MVHAELASFLANNPAACIPQDRRLALAQGRPLSVHAEGVALFADLSDFTVLTDGLVRRHGPHRAPEALSVWLNPVYACLNQALECYGGSLIAFVGDGVACWFEGRDAAVRAVASALAMQEEVREIASPASLLDAPFPVTLKVAVVAGKGHRLVVGEPGIQLFDLIAGKIVQRLVAVERVARPGEVVICRKTAQQLSSLLVTGEERNGLGVVVQGLTEPVPCLPPDGTLPDLPSEEVRSWVLPEVYRQLQGGRGISAEIRPVTTLMIRFQPPDFEHDAEAGGRLDAFVRWSRRVVHEQGGSFLLVVAGDKGAFVHAVFGAPRLRENDIRRALNVALMLHAPPPDFAWLAPVQIGISHGEVWAGCLGTPSRYTYTVMGQEVNLASRLMERAAPGEILVSRRVAQQPGFSFFSVGRIPCKGFPEPVAAWRLTGEQSAGNQPLSVPLIGREEGLESLLAFARARLHNGQAGMAVVSGEAGIGKSRLLAAMLPELQKEALCLGGQCEAVLQPAFSPFVDCLKQIFRQRPDAPEAANKEAFEQELVRLIGVAAALPNGRQLQKELRRTASILGALLGLFWPDSLYEKLNPLQRHTNTQVALATLFELLARQQPLVLALEDVHWIDRASQEVVRRVLGKSADFPLLFLFTSRNPDDSPCREMLPARRTIPLLVHSLTPFTPEQVRLFAAAMLGAAVDQPLYTFLLEKSARNPFFAREIILSLRDADRLRWSEQGGQQVVTLAAAPSDPPLSLTRLLIARLDHLPDTTREVVQTAAVLGPTFETALLTEMLQRPVKDDLLAAVNAQIWHLEQGGTGSFQHLLLHEVTRSMQPAARLRELHYRAAATAQILFSPLTPERVALLARHYEQAWLLGHPRAAPKAREYLWQAGTQAAARYENDQAADWFSRAMALVPDDRPEQRYALLLEREEIHHRQGHRTAQQADLDQLEQLAARLGDAQKAQVALRRAGYHEIKARLEEAAACVRQAVALAVAAQQPLTELDGCIRWGDILLRAGRHAEAAEKYVEGLRLAEQTGDRWRIARALRGLGNVAGHRGEFGHARAYHERTLTLFREAGDRTGEAGSLGNVSQMLYRLGRHREAIPFLEQALAISQEIGDRHGEAVFLAHLSMIFSTMGEYACCEQFLNHALTSRQEIGDRLGELACLNNLGLIARTRGDYALAGNRFAEARHISGLIEDRVGEGYRLSNQALLDCLEGKLVSAEENNRLAIAIGREHSAFVLLGYALTYRGEVLLALGRLAEAEAACREAQQFWSEQEGMELPMETGAILVAVLLAQGERERAGQEAQQIAEWLPAEGQTDNFSVPLRVWLRCYEGLEAVGDARADRVLRDGWRRLRLVAQRLPEEMRSCWLAVAAHERLALLAAQKGLDDPVTETLPRVSICRDLVADG
jgi:class 3 adenylate cyclase/tetratricopeptide (TPR) repeat protein